VRRIAFSIFLGLLLGLVSLSSRATGVTLHAALKGEAFALELRESDAFLHVQLKNIPGPIVATHYYEGNVAGHPGAWVRASFADNQWRGMVGLRGELFGLSNAVTAQTTDSSAQEDRIVNVELSPLNLSLPLPNSFIRGSLPSNIELTPTPAWQQIKESSSDLTPTQRQGTAMQPLGNEMVRLELELYLDRHFLQYASSFNLDPAATALEMINLVDGIYRSELGIRVALTGISADTLFAPSVLSETTDAQALLSEFESKKNANLIFSQGSAKLGHLITSRSLDTGLWLQNTSGVVGLAYARNNLFDAPILCSASALSLSLAYIPEQARAEQLASYTAITIAHEIAHTLGAIHDGKSEPGYVSNGCSASQYIMSAQENGSTHFSQCSKQEIANEIQRVRQAVDAGQLQNCLIDLVDLDLTLVQAPATFQPINTTSSRRYSLTNRSRQQAEQIRFSGSLASSTARFVAVSASNSTCVLTDEQHYLCELPRLAASTQVNVEEIIEFLQVGEVIATNKIKTFNSQVGGEDIDQIDVLTTQLHVLDLQAPAAPTEVNVRRQDEGIEVEWKDNSDVEEGFLLERSVNNGAFIQISSDINANVTRYFDESADDHRATYVYRVRAVNRMGVSESADSPILHSVKSGGSGGGGGSSCVVFIALMLIFMISKPTNLCELDH